MSSTGVLTAFGLQLGELNAATASALTRTAAYRQHLIGGGRMIPHITISPYSCKCILHPLTQSGVR